MRKHTLGPWVAMPRISGGGEPPKDFCIHAGAHWVVHKMDGWNEKANARLIASAPDLLSSLKKLLEEANTYSDKMKEIGLGASELGSDAPAHSIAGMARAAISKAEGK